MPKQNTARDIDVFVDDIDLVIDRLHTATRTNNPENLADRLHTTCSAIAEARRRESIPLMWLLEPYRSMRISPAWILYGTGNMICKRVFLDGSSLHSAFLE